MKLTAVILDATGIQQYIFGSTQLKENIGASYLVGNIYEDILYDSLEDIEFKKVDLNEWKQNSEINPDSKFSIGYIGGGNALLFFKDQNKAKSFINTWTRKLLIESPGLRTAAAFTYFELNDFPNELKKILKKLKENKFRFQPQILLPSHGITAECNRTGLSAEICRKYDDKFIPVSSVVASKTDVDVINKANEKLRIKFQIILKNKYNFPKEIGQLGQQKGENNYISIVHIDGNGIGDRFKECKTYKEIKELSINVDQATEKSMEKILKVIVDNYPIFKDKFNLKDNFLPVRPIIIGGDDITFITDGRLGVYFAKLFIEEFIKYDAGNEKLSACAGIAITKSKYPFSRGYKLAEQLCREAKKKAKDEDNKSSWLDFHIASGGFSGSITEIREKNYTVPGGNLCLRPYRVAGINNDYINLKDCVAGIKYFNDIKWPQSKLMELREVLNEETIAAKQFIAEVNFRDLKLPKVRQNPEFERSGWVDGKTPYFDMIELKEFYPYFEIDEVKK